MPTDPFTFNGPLFAARVRAARGERTLREVGRHSGVSAATHQRVETQRSCDLATFLALCAWMDANPYEFFQSAALSEAALLLLRSAAPG